MHKVPQGSIRNRKVGKNSAMLGGFVKYCTVGKNAKMHIRQDTGVSSMLSR